MDLIRLLLLWTESRERPAAMKDYSEPQILYHIQLAKEAGLLDALIRLGERGDVVSAKTKKLTWDGHEFLDAARDEFLWNRAKKKVSETGGAWTLEGLKIALFEIIRRNITGE